VAQTFLSRIGAPQIDIAWQTDACFPVGLAIIKRNAFLIVCAGGHVMSSNFRSEGTVIKQDEKTSWFRKEDIVGEEVPILHAFHLVEAILGRYMNTFEFNLLNSRPPVDGSMSIKIISMMVSDTPSDGNYITINYIRSIKHVVLGYLVTEKKNRARLKYGDATGTVAFYDTDGQLVGERWNTGRMWEPTAAENLLIDPIDLLAGPIADIVRAAGKAFLGSFRAAMVGVEERLLARGMTSEVAKIRVLTEEELSMVWGRGPTARPLTDNQVERAIKLLRDGHDVRIESIGQMHQIQGQLGKLGVRPEGSSAIIPQRPPVSRVGKDGLVVKEGGVEVKEIPGSYRDGQGTYRVDDAHAPGTLPYHPHNEYPHINITLPNGKTLSIVVTGSKSF
jgi:hypothetical protein